MTNQEIAFQLTMKAMDAGLIPYINKMVFSDLPTAQASEKRDNHIEFNADAVAKYYNTLLNRLTAPSQK